MGSLLISLQFTSTLDKRMAGEDLLVRVVPERGMPTTRSGRSLISPKPVLPMKKNGVNKSIVSSICLRNAL